MRQFDIAIVGAGLAGSLAAAMLAKRGHAVALIDPHRQFRPDFRCEKLEEPHLAILRSTGLYDDVVAAAHRYDGVWVARFGRLCEYKPREEYGIDYSALVNRLRALVPATAAAVCDTVRAIALSPDRQTLTLASGDTISARLVVAANGLNGALLGTLGLHRRDIGRCHSVSIGFDVRPELAPEFPFHALTYFGESSQSRISYLTLFSMATGMRGNLFVYRDAHDPWLRQFRDAPDVALKESLPRLKPLIGAFKVTGPVKLRPVDLYVTDNAERPGIVLVGDAYATVCPISGTGAVKALNDVERLCHVYVPRWMATPGMDTGKIAQFYADPDKLRTDGNALRASLFAKRVALTPGLGWSTVRLTRAAASFGRGFITRRRRPVWRRTEQAARLALTRA